MTIEGVGAQHSICGRLERDQTGAVIPPHTPIHPPPPQNSSRKSNGEKVQYLDLILNWETMFSNLTTHHQLI